MIKRIIHKLLLSCQEATLLLELKGANQISVFQNIRLSLHLTICSICRIYKQKSNIINKYFEDKIHDEAIDNQATIERLKEKINRSLSANK